MLDYTGSLTRDTFSSGTMVHDAVLRNLREILGEAGKAIPPDVRALRVRESRGGVSPASAMCSRTGISASTMTSCGVSSATNSPCCFHASLSFVLASATDARVAPAHPHRSPIGHQNRDGMRFPRPNCSQLD